MQLRHLAARAPTPSPPLAASPSAPAPSEPPAPAASETPSKPNSDAILDSIGELTYEWDLVHDRLLWGENFAKVLGPLASADLSTGMAFGARLSPESSASRYDTIIKSEKKDEGAGVRYQIVYGVTPPRESGGAPIWLEDHGCWFAGPDGRPARAHGVVRVITERHHLERKLARQSQFDPLTGVLNRTHLSERIERMLDGFERDRRPFAVILVALENLFALNRTYGYDAGDEVIAGLATRLARNVRATDVIGRHAGNKFAIALQDCDTEQAQAAATRLIEQASATPFETAAGLVPARIRIGGVIAPREGRTVHALFQRAEEALDVARQRVGARFVAYSASLAREDARLRALQIADGILAALSEQRVELAFQPIVDAADGQPAFYEALLRVRLADGSVVSPGSILPVAEKAGLVRLLDERVLELALAQLVEKPKLSLSVNASLASLLDPEWLERLAAACAATAGLPERLTVEITETSVIEDVEATSHVIAACKRLGVKVAMDDFGAGHTSFRNLRALAFDLVKIDGAFVQNIAKSADDRFFVRTLINLAHHLELRIVAEWVEDSETATLLREWGVDYFQGSLYGSAGPENSKTAKP
ncbi:MAG TPA: bifunctional diguanylate cyclase/phosphodiesterase [Methylocystis sp.]|nr:bifunctional diguanylate cyclase/phosphodiesterase [Methylocystis sp.]